MTEVKATINPFKTGSEQIEWWGKRKEKTCKQKVKVNPKIPVITINVSNLNLPVKKH